MTHSAQPTLTASPPTCVICIDPPTDPLLQAQAQSLAKQLALPITPTSDVVEVQLVLTPKRLELCWQTPSQSPRRGRPILANWLGIDTTSPQGRRLRQPIARAVGIRKGDPYRPTIIDATAGFGEDAWLFASLGCHVTMIERQPIIAALLTDTLHRVATSKPQLANRISLIVGDAQEILPTLSPAEVVYLDPMFPPRRSSGLENKRMRLLRRLAGHDPDASDLFHLACQTATRRVVVKRPLHADTIDTTPPAATHKGKSLRYDVYSTRLGQHGADANESQP